MRNLLAVIVLVGASAISAGAQYSSSKSVVASGFGLRDGELNVSVAYSPASPQFIGITQNRKLFLAGVGYSFELHEWQHTTLRYVMDVVPVALVTQPAQIVSGTLKPARTIYGGGGSPIGFQLNLAPHSSVQPFFSSHGGILYFTEQVPVPGSSHFNFTFHFGAGLDFFRHDMHFLTVAYRFHHLSNAETGRFNPGIDSNLIYMAVPVWRRARLR